MDKYNFSLFKKNNNPHLKKIIEKTKEYRPSLMLKPKPCVVKKTKFALIAQDLIKLSPKKCTIHIDLNQKSCVILNTIRNHLSYVLLLILRTKAKITCAKSAIKIRTKVTINEYILQACKVHNISIELLINYACQTMQKI